MDRPSGDKEPARPVLQPPDWAVQMEIDSWPAGQPVWNKDPWARQPMVIDARPGQAASQMSINDLVNPGVRGPDGNSSSMSVNDSFPFYARGPGGKCKPQGLNGDAHVVPPGNSDNVDVSAYPTSAAGPDPPEGEIVGDSSHQTNESAAPGPAPSGSEVDDNDSVHRNEPAEGTGIEPEDQGPDARENPESENQANIETQGLAKNQKATENQEPVESQEPAESQTATENQGVVDESDAEDSARPTSSQTSQDQGDAEQDGQAPSGNDVDTGEEEEEEKEEEPAPSRAVYGLRQRPTKRNKRYFP